MEKGRAKQKIKKLKEIGVLIDNDIEFAIDYEVEKHLEEKLEKKEKKSKSNISIIKKNISSYNIQKNDFEDLLFN